jgi:poly-gamma-glutamate synthesis protein (capsule biosynthesis protein)
MLAQAPVWRLTICGDWAPRAGQEQALTADPISFYGDLLPTLRLPDLAIVNLEGVIGDEQLKPSVKDGVHLRFSPDILGGLTAVPFHLVCLANNHILDFGGEGLAGLLALLEQSGIQWVGGGMRLAEAVAPRFFRFGETRLAVLNLAEGEESRSLDGGPGAAPFDIPVAQDQLAALRGQADARVVIAHAGREHLPAPAPYIRDAYRALVDAGATLVIGHHPHVPQGMEIYRGAPIVYSLGNFTMYIDSPLPLHRVGYIVKARFRGPALADIEIVPYAIEPSRLRLLDAAESATFRSTFKELSDLISEPGRLETIWDAFADYWLQAMGLRELSDGLAVVAGPDRLLQSVVKQAIDRQPRRLSLRILWRLYAWLERRANAARPRPTSDFKRQAALLRNRFDTPAHRELYRHALRRVMEGQAGSAPEWANQMLSQWNLRQGQAIDGKP